ncbi:glycoside hydrolase family 2 protein [Psychroserpens sp. SPM9]|uniref:beta-mannosidase n=1 Tax=Psychroserpens sp. SPM9 TaxID=2975598 RepID=UPI0021A7068F|nr:glycoside hydrolase family 2 protein [Psychroserpens sp. SPM9]MDG5491697.1 glycoside hydrolase family 2 protein [Psychroserpens sp. SPM9]
MIYRICFLIILTFLSCQSKHDLPVTITLDNNWQFKAVNDSVWRSATVPGNVHSDLLDHQLIEHPFMGNNEDSLQWISETDWEYKMTFSVSKETRDKKHIELNFDGLDTYASVILNDRLILKTDNAFRDFSVDVKSVLKPQNELRIRFERTFVSEAKAKKKLNYQLPEGNRIFTRKAQFQYGWDWGPELNTSGIWRPITLSAWNDLKIEDIYIHQLTLNDTLSNLLIEQSFKLDTEKKLTYEIHINDSIQNIIDLNDATPQKEVLIQIKNPKRWWPHNLGDPYLYDIKVVVRDDKKILDSMSVKKGLRTIELVTEKDSIGASFYFEVNDLPVYMKGANYIPQNSMQNKVTKAHYNQLLNDAVDANMNMLRVWGGGIYENDIFYELCDEKGILIWQDFMFACAMYPGDNDFLNNVAQEATQNVKSLRNHASIALWCGNNENSEGWHRWGWQADRSDAEKDEIWSNYLKVFDSILPETVNRLTDTDYWESSPKYGRGNPKYKTEGDAHDWWIWHDGYPFEHLEQNVPRFMSEFGFQSFPSYEAIRYINHKDAIDITSEGFKNHQKHSRGFQIIDDYMQRDFPVPNHHEDYVYVSQLLQAYGITKGIEAHRRAKPYNMGTLYWQLNDCWPAVSWSSIDFFGNWKALHYRAKKSFEPILITSQLENNTLKTYIINDTFEGIGNTLQIEIMDFNGSSIWNTTEQVYVSADSSTLKHELDLNALNMNKNNVVVVSKFGNETAYYYLTKPKDLQLHKAPIEQTISKTTQGFQITLKSKTLQKDVYLYTAEKGHFSDNYFDLLPNETLTIEFETDAKSLNDFKIKTLNNLL